MEYEKVDMSHYKDNNYDESLLARLFLHDFKDFIIKHEDSEKIDFIDDINHRNLHSYVLKSKDDTYNLFYRHYYINKLDGVINEMIELTEPSNENGKWFQVSRSISVMAKDSSEYKYNVYSQNCTMNDFLEIINNSYSFLWGFVLHDENNM